MQYGFVFPNGDVHSIAEMAAEAEEAATERTDAHTPSVEPREENRSRWPS